MAIVKELLTAGGKQLVSLSTRSLLQGAILECNNEDAFEIMKCMLKVGGKDLVMVDKSWKVDDGKAVNIFEFLSIHQRLLFDYECDDVHALNRVHKIIDLLITYGDKDAILQKNTSGGSILHNFPYFGHTRFIDLVEHIVKVGGMEFLRVQDKDGDSILHVLARSQKKVSSLYWKLLAKKELVMDQNSKGQTALHLACENNETFAIDLLLAQGGKDLAKMQDNEGNTALHYLKQNGGNFKGLKLILQAGGMDLLHCRNNKQEKAFNNNQFLIQAIEFQPDKKKLQASVAKLQKENNGMDDLKHKHEKDTSQIKKLKEIEKSRRIEIDELKARIKKLQDDAKEKDASVGKKHVLIEDNYNTASKRHKQITFATDHMIDTIFAMKKEIKDLKMENKDLTSHFQALEDALKEM